MLATFLSVAPIFGLLVLGHLLRRGGIPSFEFWNLNDRLVYWVLMPALLFAQTSAAAFDARMVGAYAAVILGSFAVAVALSLAATRLAGLAPGPATCVLQGAARHNTFIALAVAERLYGAEGLALAALASAMLIPTTNITIVALMSAMLSRGSGRRLLPAILRDIARNPLIVAVGLGVAVNLAGTGPIPVASDMARLLGGAALPIMLLSVGASLHAGAFTAALTPLALATAGRLVAFPLAIVLLAALLGLPEMAMVVALLYGATPTATSSYTLARQMGADAPLMAAIISVQTALSFVTLPLTIALATLAYGA